MKITSDHYFHIGHEHLASGKPCQDHALSFANETGAGVVISDGCSDGKETDMGARISTFSMISAMRDSLQTDEDQSTFLSSVIRSSKKIRTESKELLKLSPQDLLATAVHAVVTKTFGYAHVWGDGCIAWKERTGKVVMIRYDWAKNTPCYPSYDFDNFQTFSLVQGAYPDQGLTETVYEWTEATGFVQIRETHFSIEEGKYGITTHWSEEQLKNIAYISVASDGLTSVVGIDWKEVILETLAFKSTTGEFLKRRLIRMNKVWARDQTFPRDDVACATIHINPNKGEEHDDS